MAVYEFKCKSCDNRFDVMRPMSRQHEPASCPTCHSQETMRLLSLFSAATSGKDVGMAEPCATSAMMGRPCCRRMPGGGCGDA